MGTEAEQQMLLEIDKVHTPWPMRLPLCGLRPTPFVETFVDGYEAIRLFGNEAISGSWAMECEPCRIPTTFVVQPRSPYYAPHIGLSGPVLLILKETGKANNFVGIFSFTGN